MNGTLPTIDSPAAAFRSSPAPGAGSATSVPPGLPACARIGDLQEARSRLAAGDPGAAWSAACNALRQRPFHPEAVLFLAEIAEAVGHREAAHRCLDHAARLVPAWDRLKATRSRLLSASRKAVSSGAVPWLVLPDAMAASAPGAGCRLSICLIVLNEEGFLDACLRSVRGLADQVVVVDTGSTDRTCEVARAHGAELHPFRWIDDFAAARNASLAPATGDWVLVLDADEELPPDQHPALRRLMAAQGVLTWRLPIQDVGRESDGCSYVPRLFRNAPGGYFVGRIHEQAFSSLEASRRAWGLESRLGDATLRHHGYSAEVTRSRSKVARNLRLIEMALAERPANAALLMNHALELVRSGRGEEGLARYRAAWEAMSLEEPGDVVPEVREALLDQYSSRLLAVQRPAEVVALLTSPLARRGGLPAGLHFSLGMAHMALGQHADASREMQACLRKRKNPSLTPGGSWLRGAGPRHCLARCFVEMGELAEAEAEFRRARDEDPRALAPRLDYARFLHSQRRSPEALQELLALTGAVPDSPDPWRLGGGIALSRPEFLEVALDWTEAAHARLPADAGIAAQRAEALLLSGRLAEALPLWRQLAAPPAPPTAEPAAAAAAVVLCSTALGLPSARALPTPAPAVHQAFLRWLRRLVEFGSLPVLNRLAAAVQSLETLLPEAARVVRIVAAEATGTGPRPGSHSSPAP